MLIGLDGHQWRVKLHAGRHDAAAVAGLDAAITGRETRRQWTAIGRAQPQS